MSRTRAPTSPPAVLTSNQNGDTKPADLEAQLPERSAPNSLGPDHNASSPNKESLDTLNRRPKRSHTSTSYRPKLAGRQWKPGEEPGIDPNGPHPGTAPVNLHEECQITVVDFSQQDVEVRELNNEQLPEFMEEVKDESLTCRWINVNGISWDVISLLGKEKKFHRLAIEDMLHSFNRTKADWYSDHTYIVLPLQKLIHVHDEDCEVEHDSRTNLLAQDPTSTGPVHKRKKRKGWAHKVAEMFRGPSSDPRHNAQQEIPLAGRPDFSKSEPYRPAFAAPTGMSASSVRTLQHFQIGSNIERTEYMEMHSALRPKGLAVSVEQVSIFLTADNTVVSFFEHSADDVEAPIMNRLSSKDTILRRSSDASMLVQAILDAIIDLAIPVTVAYKDAIDELELNVLTDPAIKHTRSLYSMVSELGSFRSNISPVASLVNALRDHKPTHAASSGLPVTSRHQSTTNIAKASDSTVVINPTTYTYLGDVEDHILLITDNLDQMRHSADNMIGLIFNTISAYQNEAMRQLTTVTIVFLPLTFMCSYFGMNFRGPFPSLNYGDYFFWWVAVPVGFVTTMLLLRDAIARWFVRVRQRQRVKAARKRRGNAANADKQKTS